MTKWRYLYFFTALLFGTSIGYTQKEAPNGASEGDFTFAQAQPLEVPMDEARESTSCESVDLREKFQEKNMPDRRHQDTTGWCYAFVAADIVSYELGRNISPADIAKNYLNHGNPEHLLEELSPRAQTSPLGGGFTREAILETIENGGFCLESEYPSEDYSNSLERALPEAEGVKAEYVPVCLDPGDVEQMFTKIPIPELMPFMRDNELRTILSRLTNSTCTRRFSIPEELTLEQTQRVVYTPYDAPENSEFHQTLDEVLNDERPISLSVDSNAFQPHPTDALSDSPVPRHQIVVSGRRFNEETGRCEYLIRNTEHGCRLYNEEFECENNHFWMSREMVRMVGFTADYFSSSSGQD